MAKSFLNIHFYAKNIKKIFKNWVKCKKSGNFGLLNQEFGFSKVYYIYSFYFIKNRSAEKSLLNRESLLYLRLLNQESTVIDQIDQYKYRTLTVTFNSIRPTSESGSDH